ncbi:MAG: hypothetical protein E7225_05700 [Clostridiales bacterium]|nr:hypothetical protein [Clostridiales bacterium]
MKVGFLSLSFGSYSDMERVFKVASEAGYDGVDIWGGRPMAYPWDMDEAECAKIVELKKKYNLETPCYTPEALGYPYSFATVNEKELADTIAYFKKAIEVAAATGTPRVQIAQKSKAPDVSRKDAYNNMIKGFKEIAEYAAKYDVTLILEAVTIYESNMVAYLDDLVEILEEVNHPNFKTMMDTATPFAHGESFSVWFERLGDKIDYIHFVNNDGGSPAHLPVNGGSMNMAEVLEVIKAHGYDGWLTSELISAAKEPELTVKSEAKAIRALL